MSHLPERSEKVCLNCGAALHGRFCHVCGQENIAPKESFWHLVTHFVYDIVHFDGKFFSTLKYLLFRPGFLSHEYLRGRRADYLHPIRMYVFTSAFFFLIFFSFYQKDEAVYIKENKESAASILKKLKDRRSGLQKDLTDTGMPAMALKPLQDGLALVEKDIALLERDSTATDQLQSTNGAFTLMSFENEAYRSLKTVAAYDSLQKSLPRNQRDGFFTRKLKRQNLHLNEKFHGDSKAIWKSIIQKFRHLFPQMLFVSLPLFALALMALYGRRRDYYYVNHVIYSIHLFCATFIIILAALWLNSIWGYLHWGTDWLNTIFTLASLYYWYKSMRNFYEQGRWKTVLKYILLFLMSLFIMMLVFTVFFIFSAMAI